MAPDKLKGVQKWIMTRFIFYMNLLVKEDIMLWASSKWIPDWVHILLDVQSIDLGSTSRGWEQAGQYGSK